VFVGCKWSLGGEPRYKEVYPSASAEDQNQEQFAT
jgi:hypothetical protein